jgi:hypothetical protein
VVALGCFSACSDDSEGGPGDGGSGASGDSSTGARSGNAGTSGAAGRSGSDGAGGTDSDASAGSGGTDSDASAGSGGSNSDAAGGSGGTGAGQGGSAADAGTDFGCATTPCGNGTLDPGEECDLGVRNSDTGKCTKACKNWRCGDGLRYKIYEACDDGAQNDKGEGYCTTNCTQIQKCGDTIIQGTENSDDGVAACSSNCDSQGCPIYVDIDAPPGAMGRAGQPLLTLSRAGTKRLEPMSG